jgi:hypothetical protein
MFAHAAAELIVYRCVYSAQVLIVATVLGIFPCLPICGAVMRIVR